MDNQKNALENQDVKQAQGLARALPTVKDLSSVPENDSGMLHPPLTEDEAQQSIDSYIKETDQLINTPLPAKPPQPEQIIPVEKPLFIALKDDPVLVNKIQSFLRTHTRDDESYKVFIIGPEITEKLFETYWFGKLNEEEQKIRIEQQQATDWQEGAGNLANNLFEVLSAAGFEKSNFEFNIRELKQEYAVVRKIKLNGTTIKQMIDTLLVFGYVVQTNDETAFNKLQFQLVHTNDLKIRYLQNRISAYIDDIGTKQVVLEELNDQLAEAIKLSDEQLMQNESATSLPSTDTDTE